MTQQQAFDLTYIRTGRLTGLPLLAEPHTEMIGDC
jgi:hypothetical protein